MYLMYGAAPSGCRRTYSMSKSMSKFLVPHCPLSPVGPFVRLDPIFSQAESHRPLLESASSGSQRFQLYSCTAVFDLIELVQRHCENIGTFTHARNYQYPHPARISVVLYPRSKNRTHSDLKIPYSDLKIELTHRFARNNANLDVGYPFWWSAFFLQLVVPSFLDQNSTLMPNPASELG